VHLTQIINNKVQKIDICEECSKLKGIDLPESISFTELFMDAGQKIDSLIEDNQPVRVKTSHDLKCPGCGYTEADFVKIGRLGCPECYNTFTETINEIIKSVHEGTQHIGKTPVKVQPVELIKEKLTILQKKLKDAVERESFEQAALIRDEINKLKAQYKLDD